MIEPLTPELKDQNFRNMVHFYQEELMSIMRGKRVYDFFTIGGTRSLRRLKILVVKPGSSGRHKANRVSPRAQELLLAMGDK